MGKDLASLSSEELEALQQGIMEQRASAEAALKAEARTVQDEIDRRSAAERVGAVLEGLTDADRAVLRAALEG